MTELPSSAGEALTSAALPSRSVWARRAARSITLLGLLLLCALGWAVIFRLELWEARPFVLLIYGALGCALLASGLGAQAGEPKWSWHWLRRLLWVLVSGLLLWVFFPPMGVGVQALFRQLSLFRFD